MGKRKRNIPILFFVSEDERAVIMKKMELLGTRNLSAYLRKMAIDGQAIRLEVPELREILRLLRYSSNNLNQLAKQANETGAVYETDIVGLRDNFEGLWDAANRMLEGLSKL